MASVQELREQSKAYDEFKKNLDMSKWVENATPRCYKACVAKPGDALTSYDEKCISACVDKYIACFVEVHHVAEQRQIAEQAKLATKAGLAK